MTKIGHFQPILWTFSAKFTIVGYFEPVWCEMNPKSWKTKMKWVMYPPEMKISEISAQMRWFAGKR